MIRQTQTPNFIDSRQRKAKLLNPEDSDITFIVQDQRLPAHRDILTARSSYFRDLSETNGKGLQHVEMEIKEVSAESFRMILEYIYLEELPLRSYTTQQLLDLLKYSRMFRLYMLHEAIVGRLRQRISTSDAFAIIESIQKKDNEKVSNAENLENTLLVHCYNFIDKNVEKILKSEELCQLTVDSLEDVVCRENFKKHPFQLFNGVRRWYETQKGNIPSERVKELLDRLSSSCDPLRNLLNPVLNADQSDFDKLLQSVKTPQEYKKNEHDYEIRVNVNVATLELGARVISGKLPNALLQPERNVFDHDIRKCTFHDVSDTKGITIELKNLFKINYIVLQLPDRCPYAHYYVEVSMNGTDWQRVVDYSKYHCSSIQKLHFTPHVMRYIRVVGLQTKIHRQFRLVAIEAMFTDKPQEIMNGICVARSNVATHEHGAKLVAGGMFQPNNLFEEAGLSFINQGRVYTYHWIGQGSIQIQLPQPYIIDSIQFELYSDREDRISYSYKIETSSDLKSWTTVVNRSTRRCQGLQQVIFRNPMKVVFVKIVGTSTAIGKCFRLRHLKCPMNHAANEMYW